MQKTMGYFRSGKMYVSVLVFQKIKIPVKHNPKNIILLAWYSSYKLKTLLLGFMSHTCTTWIVYLCPISHVDYTSCWLQRVLDRVVFKIFKFGFVVLVCFSCLLVRFFSDAKVGFFFHRMKLTIFSTWRQTKNWRNVNWVMVAFQLYVLKNAFFPIVIKHAVEFPSPTPYMSYLRRPRCWCTRVMRQRRNFYEFWCFHRWTAVLTLGWTKVANLAR